MKFDLEKLDKDMQEKGWKFLGPILHYEKAKDQQATIYEKKGKYLVFGIHKNEKTILKENISKDEAEKRIKESIIEISKKMLSKSL